MIKFPIWVDIRGVMTYATVVPIGYGVWVWCDLTLSFLNYTYCQIADLTLN